MSHPPDPDEGPPDGWYIVFLAVALLILLTAVVVALATWRVCGPGWR